MIRNKIRKSKYTYVTYLFRTCFVYFSFAYIFRIYAIISCPYRMSFVCFSYVFRMCFVLLYIISYSFRIFKVSFRMFSFYKTLRRGLEFKETRTKFITLRAQPSSTRRNEPRHPWGSETMAWYNRTKYATTTLRKTWSTAPSGPGSNEPRDLQGLEAMAWYNYEKNPWWKTLHTAPSGPSLVEGADFDTDFLTKFGSSSEMSGVLGVWGALRRFFCASFFVRFCERSCES